jgi:tripartite-type tricarboxylate transporter receptor subunit TctC
VHIPYRGGSQILTDVISGQIDLGVTTVSNAASMIAAKRVKVLGVSSKKRVSVIKEVPTFAESRALKDLEMQVWALMFAPLGTPPAVVSKLNTAINTALELPSIKTLLVKLGAELPGLLSPSQAQAFLQAEQKMYRPVVSRIKPE